MLQSSGLSLFSRVWGGGGTDVFEERTVDIFMVEVPLRLHNVITQQTTEYTQFFWLSGHFESCQILDSGID
jgi:hypothetical protein